jgi:predicted permease
MTASDGGQSEPIGGAVPEAGRSSGPQGGTDREAGGAVAVAAALTRAILLLYPRSFWGDVGDAMVRDVCLQFDGLHRSRGAWAAWRRVPAIAASLVGNGFGEWRERLRRDPSRLDGHRDSMPRGASRRGGFHRQASSRGDRHDRGRRSPGGRAAPGGSPFRPRVSLLDFKLGLRMMARHPGLTLIGILGMTVAIAIGVVFASAVGIVYAPLPFEDGERLVAIENWDLEIRNQDYRNLHDYFIWREQLETVEDLGAYATVRRNLIDDEGYTQTVTAAEITTAGFRLPGVPPLLGRTLVEEDMRPGAPRVLVIGYDIWRNRFAADPDVVGQEVRLGAASYTIVGVMPEGFAFPLAHGLWAPFRVEPTAYGRREGPNIRVFGRLAPGATLETARAELTAIGQRLSTEFPDTHELIRPSIIPYTAQPWDDMEGIEIPALAIIVVLLLVVIAANVGTLVYARTATRRSELLVRTALGASRSNLIGQLFVEALVIAASAAVLGIAIAGVVLDRLNVFIESLTTGGGAWFWMRFTLSPATIVWALALAVLGAVVAGLLPALGSTGRAVHAGLQGFAGGSQGGMGRTWTALIVAQVAFAVAVLPTTVFMAWEMTKYGIARPGFPAEEYVAGHLYLDPGAYGGVENLARQRSAGDAIDFDTRYANLQSELELRLQAELGATGVTYVWSYPGDYPVVRVEVEDATGGRAGFTRVEPGFFDVLEVTQLAGRRFTRADAAPDVRVVMVNRSFVNDVLGGAAATGRRIRYASGYRSGGVERRPAGTEADEWYEIVGVVEDFPSQATGPGETTAHIYHPLARGGTYPAGLIARFPRTTENAVQRTRNIAAAVDPTLRFSTLQTLAARLGELQAGQRIAGLALGLITLSVALLSMAGLYALMSYAVVRRRREIGIRRALGGQRGSILASIFGHVLAQVGIGAVAGLALAAVLSVVVGAELGDQRTYWFLAGVLAALVATALLAALGPARRGLRIEPTEALRE